MIPLRERHFGVFTQPPQAGVLASLVETVKVTL